MANIVISGARGFLASKLIPLLLDNNHNILCFTSGKAKYKNEQTFNLPLVSESELKDKAANFKPDIFLNLQVSFYFNHDENTSQEMVEANIFQPLRVLDILVESGLKHLITATSFTEYGDFHEYHPVNLFAATKSSFKTLAKYYHFMKKVSLTDVVIYDTYGEGDIRKKILNLFKENIKTNEELQMSAGDQIMDISHIDDVANGFINLIAEVDSENINICQTLCASTGNRFQLKGLAKKIEQLSNSKLNIIWGARDHRVGEVMKPIQFDQKFNICEVVDITPKLKIFISQ